MPDPCMCNSLTEISATCNVCVAKLRETITRLNRRCQEAESAACVKVEEVRKSGPSLGRALAGWAAADYRRKYEEAQKELDALKKKSKIESFLDAAKFLKMMPSWVDPGEFTRGWDAAIVALEERVEFLQGKKTSMPKLTCPSCGGECPYRNQDYVAHGYYCNTCNRTFSCDQECCKSKEAR